VLGVDVHRFLQHHIVLFLLGDLLDNLVGAFENLLQFLVLAGVEVFLEFAALALEFAVLVDQLLLALGPLRFRQRGRLALELVGQALEVVADVVEFLFATRELLLELGLRRLGGVRFPEDAVGIDEADTEVLGLRPEGHQAREDQQPLTEKMLH